MSDLSTATGHHRGHHSQRDLITGLPNRFALLDEFRRREGPQAVYVVRLEGVTTVRDTLGADHADAVVLRTAERLRAALDCGGTLGRIEGGDFVVILAAERNDPALADRLADAVAATHRLAGYEFGVTASVGVAIGVPDVGSDLIRDASRSFTGDGDDFVALRLTHDLRSAVPNRELEVYYQPIVELNGGTIAGAEALIRWNHPHEGVLTPDRWLTLADRSGLLGEIGRSTLEEVCRHFGTLNAGRPHDPLSITVNLATSELRSPGLVEFAGGLLARSGLRAHHLIIEVDGASIADETARAALESLRSLGVRLSVDDLGAALSELSRSRLPIDQLKFDAAILPPAADYPIGGPLIAGVVELSARLGVTTVAEGVTHDSEARLLRGMGCDHAQGWLYGRPLPYSRFCALLERINVSAAAPGSRCEPARAFDALT